MGRAGHSAGRGRTVGRVVGLWRYPVKAMASEALPAAAVDRDGLVGDRRWAFVRAGSEDSSFPWLTLRQRPDLHLYRPEHDDPSRPDTSTVTVTAPDGRRLPLTDPGLAAELGGDGVRLLHRSAGVFDALPLSLLTTATVAGLERLVGVGLDARRFRPNLLVRPEDGEDGGDTPEQAWVGRTLRIGSARLHVDEPDHRCAVVDVDPVTGRRSGAGVLRAVVRERQGCAGVYGSTLTPGTVRVGDAVRLEP